MSTIGLLYSLQGGAPRECAPIRAKLHMNYWKISSKNRYLDFGVMLNGPYELIKSLWFYFPFEIKDGSVSDLGDTLNNTKMICNLFDSEYEVQQASNTSFSKVSANPNSDDQSFYLYRLGTENFTIVEGFNNHLLEIKFNSTPPKSETEIKQGDNKNNSQNTGANRLGLYFRIRVTIPAKSYYSEGRIANDVFQSAFSKAELVDIRINDRRELDYSLRESLNAGKEWLEFTKVHFFYCSSSDDEQIVGSLPYNDCKLLDVKMWNDYLKPICDSRNKFMAYHWKIDSNSKRPMSKYGIFVRTVFQSRNFPRIVLYVFIVVILGAVGSLIATGFLKFFKLCTSF